MLALKSRLSTAFRVKSGIFAASMELRYGDVCERGNAMHASVTVSVDVALAADPERESFRARVSASALCGCCDSVPLAWRCGVDGALDPMRSTAKETCGAAAGLTACRSSWR